MTFFRRTERKSKKFNPFEDIPLKKQFAKSKNKKIISMVQLVI